MAIGLYTNCLLGRKFLWWTKWILLAVRFYVNSLNFYAHKMWLRLQTLINL